MPTGLLTMLLKIASLQVVGLLGIVCLVVIAFWVLKEDTGRKYWAPTPRRPRQMVPPVVVPQVRVQVLNPGDSVKESAPPKVIFGDYRNVRVVQPREGEVLGEANPFGPSVLVQWADGKVEEVPAASLKKA
jgi:hypothetical protein